LVAAVAIGQWHFAIPVRLRTSCSRFSSIRSAT
jgi:hypothetical protein